jgi:hypothetical protein
MHCDGFVCEEKPEALGSGPGDAGRQAGYNADDNLPKSFRTSDTTNQPTKK